MGDDALESELDQVTTELATARIEYASLGARIAGLQGPARRAEQSSFRSGPAKADRPPAQLRVPDRRDRRNPGCGWHPDVHQRRRGGTPPSLVAMRPTTTLESIWPISPSAAASPG